MKSRIGISVGLLGCISYCIAYFGGYIPLVIVVGYILLVEKNDWLQYVAVKALCVNIMFSIVGVLISLIPDFLGIIQDFIYLFKGTFSYQMITSIQSLLQAIISFIKPITYLLLAYKAMLLRDVSLPVIDQMIYKHMGGEA